MKSIIKYIPLSILIVSMAYLSSCKSGDDPVEETEEQIFLEKITGTWKSSVVMMDGKDVSQSFPNMSIAISDTKAITVTNPVPPIWKASSTFVLEQSGTGFVLKRNDGLIIAVPQTSTSKIVLTFEYDPAVITGRVESVKGRFTFELTTP